MQLTTKKIVLIVLAFLLVVSLSWVAFSRVKPKGEVEKALDAISADLGADLKMIHIPAGTFIMGSPEEEVGHDDDEVQHKVTLTKDFWLGKYEVSQKLWKTAMGSNPSYFKFRRDWLCVLFVFGPVALTIYCFEPYAIPPHSLATCPVDCVSWNDAMEFCRRLNEKYASLLPEGYHFSLPTEAQWEYACRAGTASALNNGKELKSARASKCRNLDEVANCRNCYDDIFGYTCLYVGQKKPNAWGLYDMHGNVFEWCLDWYGSYSGDATDPVGAQSGSYRVLRGGAANFGVASFRSALRWGGGEDYCDKFIGFRLALVPVQ